MAAIHEFPPQEPKKPDRKPIFAVEARDEDERAELQLLRNDLLDAAGSGDADAINGVKLRYEKMFPDENEAVEALFGMIEYLDTQRAVDEIRRRGGGAPKELYRNLTEYNFLLSHFVSKNRDSRVFLEAFWTLLQKAAERWSSRGGEFAGKLRASIVTEIGTSRAFEELHEVTETAHPNDDAFRCTDLWTEDHPVQVKAVKGTTPEFIEVDTITFPATRVRRAAQDRYYTSHFDREIDRFSFNIKKYADQREHRAATGYFVVVPYRMVDSVTGEPTEELIEYFRTHMPGGSVPIEARRAA